MGAGSATISNSEFSGNSAEYNGGVIYVLGAGKATISNSEFSGNSAANGGAIVLSGYATISNSEFSGNSAESGGAILNSAEATISNSEFSGNSAESGGAILNHGMLALGDNTFLDNSPDDCYSAHCVSVPGGGIKEPVGIGASTAPATADDAGTAVPSASAVAISGDPQDVGGSATWLNVAHGDLLGIERVACTADDIYFILRLKSDTPVREHLLEVFVSTDGSAVLADILPIPKHESLPERLLSVTSLALVGEGINVVTGFPLVGSVFHAGAELTEWIDEQFTRSSSPLHFRLTWYNTDAHPGH